jgi:uncharacterized membrane protein
MTIKIVFLSYLLTLMVFLAIDMLWLGVIAKNIYNKYLGNLLTDSVNWTAAIIFYFIYVVGISVFVIYPSLNKDSVFYVIFMGALFGFFTYATYDLTNLATLKGWPLPIVIIDIVWGSALSAIVGFSGFKIVKWLT